MENLYTASGHGGDGGHCRSDLQDMGEHKGALQLPRSVHHKLLCIIVSPPPFCSFNIISFANVIADIFLRFILHFDVNMQTLQQPVVIQPLGSRAPPADSHSALHRCLSHSSCSYCVAEPQLQCKIMTERRYSTDRHKWLQRH